MCNHKPQKKIWDKVLVLEERVKNVMRLQLWQMGLISATFVVVIGSFFKAH